MRTVLGTTPSHSPPRAVPTMEPVAMMSTNGMLWRSRRNWRPRLRILTRLRHGACLVGDLSAVVEMEQSAVSHQLRLLRCHGFGDRSRSGRSVIYDLYDNHVAMLLDEAVTISNTSASESPTTLRQPPDGCPQDVKQCTRTEAGSQARSRQDAACPCPAPHTPVPLPPGTPALPTTRCGARAQDPVRPSHCPEVRARHTQPGRLWL
jgi:DNA-binding transcriptional ArsR family regulator